MSPRATSTLPNVQPILLTLRREPFNGPAWLFEPKYDGYRGLYVTRPLSSGLARKRLLHWTVTNSVP